MSAVLMPDVCAMVGRIEPHTLLRLRHNNLLPIIIPDVVTYR